MNNEIPAELEVATLGGGCFWCMEAVLKQQKGVKSVVSGYAGGRDPAPTYQEVCGGGTGHAEVVQVRFCHSVISFSEILDLFWKAHDPTTLNRQGNDVGTQYRSVIYYHNDRQKDLALNSKAKEQKHWMDSIVTEIEPLETFYAAEDYHQDYYANNTHQGYCTLVIRPKLKKLGLKY